jgi:hypothetical protein
MSILHHLPSTIVVNGAPFRHHQLSNHMRFVFPLYISVSWVSECEVYSNGKSGDLRCRALRKDIE